MAIYHCTVNIISRAKGGNAVASAAYRSSELIHDERLGINHDYTRKTGVDYTEIIAPDNTAKDYCNRATLWNAVENIEKRKDAQVAREVEVALPRELDNEQKVKLVQYYAKANFVNHGMIADIAIHKINGNNPHAHIMLTTREITEKGFGKKARDWNDKQRLQEWRESWAELSNRYLEKNHQHKRVDHRSYKDQGIDKTPMNHLGKDATALERKGIDTRLGDYNRLIKELNQKFIAVKSFFQSNNLSQEATKEKTSIAKEEYKKQEYYAEIRNIEREKKAINISLGNNPLQNDYYHQKLSKELKAAEQKEQGSEQSVKEHQESYKHRSIFKKMFGIGNREYQLSLETKEQVLKDAQKERLSKENQLKVYENKKLKALEKQYPSLEREKEQLEKRQTNTKEKINQLEIKNKNYEKRHRNEYSLGN